jgi:SAM-dependent methyltransferase
MSAIGFWLRPGAVCSTGRRHPAVHRRAHARLRASRPDGQPTGGYNPWLERRLRAVLRLCAEHGLEFPLIEAAGEDVPLPDASFDLVHSEYGASIWADPYHWIPEAARLLRPGGRLIFLRNSTLLILCQELEPPVGERLARAQRGLHRIEWPDTGEIEFHLGHGEWIDLLRENGFEIERLIELYAPDDAKTHTYYDYVTPEWAHKWPAEEIWVARKRA